MKRLSTAGVCLLVLMFLFAFAHAFTPTYVLTVDVTQGMDGEFLGDPGFADRAHESALHAGATHRSGGSGTVRLPAADRGENEFRVAMRLPIPAEELQGCLW